MTDIDSKVVLDIIDHHYRESATWKRNTNDSTERMYHEGRMVILHDLRCFIKELAAIKG